MDLQNGYKVIYEASERDTTTTGRKFFASKTIPELTDAKLKFLDNGGATELDMKTFKLIYSDGTHLLGSTEAIPTTADKNIVIKNATGDIVYGKIIEEAVEVAPVVEVEPAVEAEPVVKAAKKAKKAE